MLINSKKIFISIALLSGTSFSIFGMNYQHLEQLENQRLNLIWNIQQLREKEWPFTPNSIHQVEQATKELTLLDWVRPSSRREYIESRRDLIKQKKDIIKNHTAMLSSCSLAAKSSIQAVIVHQTFACSKLEKEIRIIQNPYFANNQSASVSQADLRRTSIHYSPKPIPHSGGFQPRASQTNFLLYSCPNIQSVRNSQGKKSLQPRRYKNRSLQTPNAASTRLISLSQQINPIDIKEILTKNNQGQFKQGQKKKKKNRRRKANKRNQ